MHVLDRLHIQQKLSKAIDKVRAAEAKQLKAEGRQPVLKNSRWLLLQWRENLSEKQVPQLEELVSLNLRTVKAYLLKEEFKQLWDCRSPTQAKKYLNRWRRRAVRSKIQPMMKVAKMLKTHRPLPFLGTVESLHNKAKMPLRKAYGFRSYKAYQLALFHTLGNLPEPEIAHRFC